jgi:hypothetical protein
LKTVRLTHALLVTAALALAGPAFAQDSAPASSAAANDQAAPPASAAAPASSATPADTKTSSAPQATGGIDAPPSGKGRIVFYRPFATGFVIGCGVHENGAKISSLPAGKYFVRDFDPGVHTFLVESEAKDTLRMEVEAGETYYVKCSIAMGIIMGRPNLSPSDKASFDSKAKGLKLEESKS